MTVRVTDLYSGSVREFRGTAAQVVVQLRLRYDWLPEGGVKEVLAALSAAQALQVEVVS